MYCILFIYYKVMAGNSTYCTISTVDLILIMTGSYTLIVTMEVCNSVIDDDDDDDDGGIYN